MTEKIDPKAITHAIAAFNTIKKVKKINIIGKTTEKRADALVAAVKALPKGTILPASVADMYKALTVAIIDTRSAAICGVKNPYRAGQQHTAFELLIKGTTISDMVKTMRVTPGNAHCHVSFIKRKLATMDPAEAHVIKTGIVYKIEYISK